MNTMLEAEKPLESVRFSEGFGFGDGSLSGEAFRTNAGEVAVGRVEAILGDPGEALTDVGVDSEGCMLDDDGCSDGRGIEVIFKKGQEIAARLNRNRAKVFGGGVAMATAALIGVGEWRESTAGNLKQLFKSGITSLQDRAINFGAHTDSHAAKADKALKLDDPHEHNPNCGCGAIDKAPAVIRSVAKYRSQIQETITSLGVDTSGLDEVLGEFDEFAVALDDSDYEGTAVRNDIQAAGKVSKRLAGDHQEGYVVFNLIHGKTVDQNKIRTISDGALQVFGIDVWRLIDISARMYPDDSEKANRAFLSQLVYSLGVSATLTKGDMPVYVIRPEAS